MACGSTPSSRLLPGHGSCSPQSAPSCREPAPSGSQGDLLADEAAPRPDRAGLSQHERRQARLQERIARLEAENIGEKDWFLKGEAGAGEDVM